MNQPKQRTRVSDVPRPPARPEPHAEDVRAPEHADTHEAPRTRTRTRNPSIIAVSHDSYIRMENIPPDVSLEWKLFTALGLEYPAYFQAMRQQGWEPVNPQEHPDWVNVPPNYPHKTVIVDGLILMERPKVLTDEAREDMRIGARQQVKEAEQRLGKTGEGELDRTKPNLQKEYMRPIQVED